jgi:hypothetical protein
MSSETDDRRKALTDGLAFALNAYLQSGSLLNPTKLAANALNATESASNRPPESFDRQEDELRAMAKEIQNMKAMYEDGRLAIYLDKKTTLDLIESMLKRHYAKLEAATTAQFKTDLGPYRDKDHDAELVLPQRSIYVKLVPFGSTATQMANAYNERARSRNPSEYWLFAPTEENFEVPFEPIFTELRILRGRLRTFPLASLIRDIVGEGHDVLAQYDGPDGYKFTISKSPVPPPRP